MKVSKYGDFSGPYFPVFGLSTEIYGVNLRIQSDSRKIGTKKKSLFGPFSRSGEQKKAQKVNKEGTKVSYILQILMPVKARFFCFISLLFDYQ